MSTMQFKNNTKILEGNIPKYKELLLSVGLLEFNLLYFLLMFNFL